VDSELFFGKKNNKRLKEVALDGAVG